VLLAVLGAGVFLAGLELMITAVALPSIVVDLADWNQLRHASWIVNGYLLVYVVTMPLAGRLADLWGARRVFIGALVAFALGSLLAGAAQTLDQLIAARLVQALGGGTLVPVATAAAAHLYSGHARPRAIGAIGALTFLGMAAGPFVGAALLGAIHAESALASAGIVAGSPVDFLAPAWRWVFYVNVPVGIVALAFAWAASAGWETPRHATRLDLPGALAFSVGLGAALIGLTLVGSSAGTTILGLETPTLIAILLAVGVVGLGLTVVDGLLRRDPFLDVRLFRRREFASAALISLLTGYGFATAIVGAAVFVDRVLYGGPSEQQLVLGSLAAATALGALASGFAVRRLSLRLVTLVGLVASTAGLAAMAAWTPSTTIVFASLAAALFGFGFGLTVTPRSTAAVEAAGRAAFGMASATVTVARMIGMAVGLAVLTAYGSTTIDRLTAQIYATPEAYQAFLPPELVGRPFRDGLVIAALERWASGEAARIMVGLFLAAAVVTALAALPALALGARRARMLAGDTHPGAAVDGGDLPGRGPDSGGDRSRDGADDPAATLAL
ncbi:MAG: MFS transporter, partial [Chloroflexota bacterium]|nr:MFS transporter [Chloroflexota bacterium]